MDANHEIILAAASRIIPNVTSLDEAGRGRFFKIISQTLETRSASMQRQFTLFLTAIYWLPILRWGVTFPSLREDRQDAFLHWLKNNPLTALRLGFWGLKSMVCMGYYGQPELNDNFRYSPTFDGNKILDAH